jgi:hypothetical protein
MMGPLCSLGWLSGLVGGNHFSRVRCCTDGLNPGILAAVVIAWGNNVAVKLAADFDAIFFDGGLCAYLNAAISDHFDHINEGIFFERHGVSFSERVV